MFLHEKVISNLRLSQVDSREFILKERFECGKPVTFRIRTPAVTAACESLTSSFGGCANSDILCMMGPSGAGISSTFIDACEACRYCRIGVDVAKFSSVVEVAARTQEFFLNQASLSHEEVLKGFKTLFEAALMPVLDDCLGQVRAMNGECSTLGGYGVDDCELPSSPPKGDESGLLLAKYGKIAKAAGQRRLLLHFENIHTIFGGADKYPSNEDLLDQPSRRITVTEAPRLAFKALLCTLCDPILSEPRIRWAFSGLPSNRDPTLNVPIKMTFVNLAEALEDFSPQEVYSVLLKHANPALPALPPELESGEFKSEWMQKMRSCMEQLSGPPIVIQFFFEALTELEIKNFEEMFGRFHEIQQATKKSFEVYKLGPESPGEGVTEDDLVLLSRSPFGDRLFPRSSHMSPGFMDRMTRSGLVRVPLPGAEYAASSLRPCPLLLKILYDRANLPLQVISQVVDGAIALNSPTPLAKGKMLEIVFISSLVNFPQRPIEAAESSDKFLKDLGLSGASLSCHCELVPTDRMDGAKCDGTSVKIAKDSRSDDRTATDLMFRANLHAPDEDTNPKRVCAAFQLTLVNDLSNRESGETLDEQKARSVALRLAGRDAKDTPGEPAESIETPIKKVNKLTYSMCRMVDCAITLHKKNNTPSVLVFGGPNMPELTADNRLQLNQYLAKHHPTIESEELRLNCPLTANDSRRFALFYIPGSNEFWKHMVVPARAIQRADVPTMLSCIINRFFPDESARSAREINQMRRANDRTGALQLAS